MTTRTERQTMASSCCITLPQALYATVARLSRTEETTVSQYVVEIVEMFIRQHRSGVPRVRDEREYLNRDDDGVDNSIYL